MPKTSIVIVSYNGLSETTAPCLESIFAHGATDDFEVIVVDNKSTDDTPRYLASFRDRESRLKCIFNRSNRGFAGGNNDGLRIACGELIILLNSDCLVTENWIEGLIAPLSAEASIGLVGPVSNAVGNEQKIFTLGRTPDEIIEEGRTWVSKSKGSRFDTAMLGFFCVALRRDVLEKVGMLDEDFGLGFYEDDDYCIRVKKAGYRLVCVEDVFVYHKGGGSFDSLGSVTRKMMKQNRKRLEIKHGSAFVPSHPRQRQLHVIGDYLGHLPPDGGDPELLFRICNRIKEIESQMPKGVLKRAILSRKIRSIKKQLNLRGS